MFIVNKINIKKYEYNSYSGAFALPLDEDLSSRAFAATRLREAGYLSDSITTLPLPVTTPITFLPLSVLRTLTDWPK